MCPIKQGETSVTDVERTQDTKSSEAGLTTNIVEQLRTELSRLRKFIGYDKIDTIDGKTGQYVFNPKAYENIFGYENQTTEEVDSETSEKQINVLTLLDYIYLIVQKDLSQDENDKDFEARVTENKNKIDQILSWLEDSKDGEVTTQGILSKVKTLWTTVTDVSEGLTKKVAENTNEISKLKTLVEDGWSEGEGADTVSYQGYKVLIKDIYDKLSDRVTAAALENVLKNYYTKTDADRKFVAQVAGKQLSTEDFTTDLKNKLDGIAAQANKTEITSTVTSDTDKVPSCAAVSAFVADKIPSTVDVTTAFVTSDDATTIDLTVSSQEANICLVRVTELTTSRVAVKSYIYRNALSNTRNLTVFNLNIDSLGYIVEVWKLVNDQPVLVKTFYTKQS